MNHVFDLMIIDTKSTLIIIDITAIVFAALSNTISSMRRATKHDINIPCDEIFAASAYLRHIKRQATPTSTATANVILLEISFDSGIRKGLVIIAEAVSTAEALRSDDATV